MENKTLGFIGILFRGDRILIGEQAREKISKGRYAFLAKDASENTKKEVTNLLEREDIPFDSTFGKDELGKAIGYDEISFLLVTDAKAAKRMMNEGTTDKEKKINEEK